MKHVWLNWCFVFLLSVAHLSAENEKPNILVILADDLGACDLGCYGSTFHETPHIDKLASEGAKFTAAYSAGSVCSPTRASLMTGKYPVRTGITDYIPGLKSSGKILSTPQTALQLPLEELTLGEAFQNAGYQTFYSGKWHLGGQGFEPSEQGFEISIGDKDLGNHGKDWQVGQKLTDSAKKFLGDRDASRPFLMYLAYHEPHTPILNYPAHIEKFNQKAESLPHTEPRTKQERQGVTLLVQDNPTYASELAGLDDFVGQVLTKLDELNLRENTIVLLLSDNGGLSTLAKHGPTSNVPLRAGKGWLYEGGIRIPCILRIPSRVNPGTIITQPIITTDIFPTLLELAGLPQMPTYHQDGVSFARLLQDSSQPTRTTMYWHYPHYHGSTWAPGSAMREGDFKLIHFLEDNTYELYNLTQDPSEQHNLAAVNSSKLSDLTGKLDTWRESTNAVMPKLNSSK
jgi:arylsulfatase A-like enzyme